MVKDLRFELVNTRPKGSIPAFHFDTGCGADGVFCLQQEIRYREIMGFLSLLHAPN